MPTDQQLADQVEMLLGGVVVYCPFCGESDALTMVKSSEDYRTRWNKTLTPDWAEAHCLRCDKAFHRRRPLRDTRAYRVGEYYTTSWRDAYLGRGARQLP